jgi:drug/metabolite transporter superfamily protein YnfA
MTNIVLAIVMLAAFALVAGAFALWRRTGEAKNPALMVLLAVIAIVNVLIWTIPTESGEAPIDQVEEAAGGS